jgi:CRISPR system Cascade subunit CasA
MTQSTQATFNLWNDPWIDLENQKGEIERLSLEEVLTKAHSYRAVFDPSPLAVVGIHRLLVAILQFVVAPEKNADLKKLWRAGRFSAQAITKFGKEYAHRFDLFSETEPFLQSSDIPIEISKAYETSSISRLTCDIPSGTYIEFYHHGNESAYFFCLSCAARQLTTVPAFATAGGRPFRPSINGVPPIYILPGGNTLFESLAASLTRPEYQPKVATSKDDAWWLHKPVVKKCGEITAIPYMRRRLSKEEENGVS